MRYEPNHRIEFEILNAAEVIPSISNPSYIYKVGETIKMTDLFFEGKMEERKRKFTVEDIEHLVLISIEGEQVIKVYLKEIPIPLEKKDA